MVKRDVDQVRGDINAALTDIFYELEFLEKHYEHGHHPDNVLGLVELQIAVKKMKMARALLCPDY